MICEAPVIRGLLKGQPATGTATGYQRHRRAKELPCNNCLKAKAQKSLEQRQRDPAKSRKASRRWELAHPEKRRESVAKWRKKNPESGRQAAKKWAKRNPEQRRINEAKRRASLANVLHIPYTKHQLEQRALMFKNRCWICGTSEWDTWDHLKSLNRRGPDCLSNLRPACRSCNSMKSNRSLFDPKLHDLIKLAGKIPLVSLPGLKFE